MSSSAGLLHFLYKCIGLYSEKLVDFHYSLVHVKCITGQVFWLCQANDSETMFLHSYQSFAKSSKGLPLSSGCFPSSFNPV